jgi:hypothetical protein
MTANEPRLEESSAPPGFGPQRTAFGMTRDRGRRLEIVLTMRGGGLLTVYDELDEEITEEAIQQYAETLGAEVTGGKSRTFSDSWGATGQRSWISLAEVTGFAVRPAR